VVTGEVWIRKSQIVDISGVTIFYLSSPRHNHPNRLCNDSEIQHQAEVVYVVIVQFDAPCPGKCVAARDLSQASDPGPHPESAALNAAVAGKVFHQCRPRPDEGHLTAQNVHKLGKLVDAGTPQYLSYSCDSILMDTPVSVELFVGILDHRPELDHFERLSVFTGSPMPEQYRAAIFTADSQS